MQDHKVESKLSKVATGILVGVVVAVVSLALEHNTKFFTSTFSGEAPAPHDDAAVPEQPGARHDRVDEPLRPERVVEPIVDSSGGEIGNEPRPSIEHAALTSSVQEPEPEPVLQKPFVRKQTANDFEFTFEECVPDGDNLRCRILVARTRKPQRIMISDHSRLKVGTQSIESSELIKDTGQRTTTAIHFDVPVGEQVEFGLVFPGQKSIKEAVLLEVKCGRFSATWDNPPIG